MSKQPFLTIITACLNRSQYITEAIESVIRQDYPAVEHLIIDGGSTDDTLDILSHYSHLNLVSEPDKGIYDAWNKGLRLAKGDVVAFLNSDDFYTENVFGSVMAQLSQDKSIDAVVGGVSYFEDRNGQRKSIWTHPAIPHDELWERVTLGSPVTNAWFIRKSYYDRFGGYDAQYRWASDREFFLRAAFAGISYTSLEETVYHYRRHAGSFTLDPTARQAVSVWEENLGIIEHYIDAKSDHLVGLRYLKLWHAQLSGEAFLLALRQRHFSSALSMMKRGLTQNSVWGVKLVMMIARKLSGRLRISESGF